MTVYVNGEKVELLPGMTVRHALIQSGHIQKYETGQKVYDEWGSEMGLSGALWDGARITVR